MTRRRWSMLLASLLLASAGCVSPGGYAADRVLDLSDVIDVEYGTGMGLGVLIQATPYLEAGLGLADVGPSREWFGRRSVASHDGIFLGLIAFTGTGHAVHGSYPPSSFSFLFVNVLPILGGTDVPVIDRFRFGGRLYLPFVHAGLSVNTGEVVDFLAGVIGFDPAADDGIPKSDTFE